jgi:hypothetical protein
MDMRDVDFEIAYEPGNDEADPLDLLSRHPLPEKENDGTERVIKAVIHNEHVVVLERLQEETNKDEQLLRLKEWNIGMKGLCAVINLNFGAPRR